MREALHIFVKDTRHQRVPIALMLAWTALFVGVNAFVLNLELVPSLGHYGGVVLLMRVAPAVLCLGLGYLLVKAVHADALCGDSQFWLTRPYRRSSLFGAKLLFLLAYVALPLAIAQMAIPVMAGFPLTALLRPWMTSQLLILVVIAVPLLAVASTTASIGWVIGSLAVPLLACSFVVTKSQELGPLSWVRFSGAVIVAFAVAGIVLWLQYGRRRTRVSQFVLLAGLIAAMSATSLIGWDAAFTAQQAATGRRGTGMSTSLVPPPALPFEVARSSRQFQLRFAIEGIAPETPVSCDASQLTIVNAAGARLVQPVRQVQSGRLTPASEGCTTFATLASTDESFVAAPVTLEGNVYVTVFDAEQLTPLALRERRDVPGYGDCTTRPGQFFAIDEATTTRATTVSCDMAFRSPEVTFGIRMGNESTGGLYRPDYSPLPATLTLQPVERMGLTFRTTSAVAVAFTRRVAAHARLPVHVANVDLKAFADVQPGAPRESASREAQ